MLRPRTIRTFCGALVVGALAVLSFGIRSNAQGPQQQPAGPMPAVLRNYQPVTAERLKTPEDSNWLMIRRTYDGWGYSPLTQITPSNVSKLKPVWVFATGEARVHESAPIVNGGVMFVSTPNNQVIAIDAKTGTVLWRYRRPRPNGSNVPHDTNRGVALYGDKVYYAAGEAVLVALDAKTGKEVWTTTVGDNKAGYYISLAPLVAGGKVMVGCSGGEYGIRGFVAGFDLDTGKEQWRTYTIPAPGEPGSETWPKGDQWMHGGGSVWVTGNYDPATNLAYWGVGNGGPWMGDKRPGDNLYTSSTIALDVATGKIKGYFQYHQNDSWDWDEVSPPLLIDYQRGGRTIKGLIDFGRDGYMWFLDRSNVGVNDGKIKFIEGKPYVYQNVFKKLDPETGRPDVDPAHKPGTDKDADFCPNLHGGKNWVPIAYSPKTRMVYVPANNNLCGTGSGTEIEYIAGRNYTGSKQGAPFVAPGGDHFGEVQAWNVDTGKKVWTHNYSKSPNWGAMMTTASGLVFTGGTNDRKIHAFDANNGKLLWEYPTSSGILAPPTSFMVDGKQYIAVHSGWGGDSRGMEATLNRLFPGDYPEVPEGGSVWVFAVE
ncbi:MAG TPA: PQQ-dependent dehydrogenase, methanol/ethanol family [Bryobacteraceae bacterium]|nr:PQQ-dependent dehydrogenase, methanol/ethanol family [Bryobacteraceae bacterium]